jgi:Tfp pilus assembly protein PilF
MTRASVRPYLKPIPLFRYLPSERQLAIAGKLTRKQITHGQVLDLRGEYANIVCIVVEGQVRVETSLVNGRFLRTRLRMGQWTGQSIVAGWQQATRTCLTAIRGNATVLLLWRQDLADLAEFRLLIGFVQAVMSIVAALASAVMLAIRLVRGFLRVLGQTALRHSIGTGILIALVCCAGYLLLTTPGRRLQGNWLYLRSEEQSQISIEARAERLGRVLDIVPDHHVAAIALGNLAAQSGDLTTARRVYAGIAQKDGTAANNLGVLLLQGGDPETAVEWLVLSTQLEPDRAIHYQNLGLAYRQVGQQQEASRAFKEALRLDPTLTASRYHLGMDHLSREDYVKAAVFFERILEQDPSSAHAYLGLGLVHMEIGDLRRAVGAFEDAARLAPGSNTIEFYLGLCQARIGDMVNARATWSKLLAHSPPKDLATRIGFLLNADKEQDLEGIPVGSGP